MFSEPTVMLPIAIWKPFGYHPGVQGTEISLRVKVEHSEGCLAFATSLAKLTCDVCAPGCLVSPTAACTMQPTLAHYQPLLGSQIYCLEAC